MSPRSFHSRHRENTTKIWRLPFFPILVSNWYRQVKTSRRKSKGHLLFRPCWTISEKRAFACSEFCLYCGNASILLGTTLGKYQASSITHSKLSSILVHAHLSSILVLVKHTCTCPLVKHTCTCPLVKHTCTCPIVIPWTKSASSWHKW